MTKAQYQVFTLRLFNLACQIGLRPAARAIGISEDQARKISSRRKWNMASLSPAINGQVNGSGGPSVSPTVTAAIEDTKRIVQHYGDRAKIGATIAGALALEHLADAEGDTLVKPCNAIAADQWTKAVDRAAGWTAARQSPVQVAVQVNMPSAEEKAELRETDAKLDEIAALLRATRPQA